MIFIDTVLRLIEIDGVKISLDVLRDLVEPGRELVYRFPRNGEVITCESHPAAEYQRIVPFDALGFRTYARSYEEAEQIAARMEACRALSPKPGYVVRRGWLNAALCFEAIARWCDKRSVVIEGNHHG